MNEITDTDYLQQERKQIVELGSDITKSSNGNIYTLTIIGQIEGHQVLPETAKTTRAKESPRRARPATVPSSTSAQEPSA